MPQKGYPADIDLTPESLRNLQYPIDWDGLLDYVGRPAILKPYSGGGWKHVYKVHNTQELLEAYDGTAPYCMTLQEFINFDSYVRCFTFGKTDITPVAYDPRERRYLVEHAVPVPRAWRARRPRRADDQPGARLRDEHDRVRHAATACPTRSTTSTRRPTSNAIGSRDFYFSARRREDDRPRDRPRAQSGPRPELAAMGGNARASAPPPASPAPRACRQDLNGRDRRLARAAAARRRAEPPLSARHSPRRCATRKLTFGDRVHCPFLRPFFLTEEDESSHARRLPRRSRRSVSASSGRRWPSPALFGQLGHHRSGGAARPNRPRLRQREHGLAARRLPSARLASFRRVQRGVPGWPGIHPAALRAVRRHCRRCGRFARAVRSGSTGPSSRMLDALLASYRDWGGTTDPPTIAIVDWREVPTWTEFEILRDAFTALGRADARVRSAGAHVRAAAR